jgi:hypothetical protein
MLTIIYKYVYYCNEKSIKSLLPLLKNCITTTLFLKQTGEGHVQPKENSKIGGAAADFIG